MADDAGALLVRSGLVPHTALDDARIRVAHAGGTIGEQLVAAGVIADDALTDFYRSRLLVPQVNPNTLARLPTKVVAQIPSDMAIELRAIPVSLDNENNLTVAMSDPSDSHAVDEIAFFTGTYVVRAVATQMQIAWCLAHYYGHITTLGQRLLQPSGVDPAAPVPEPRSSSPGITRAKGLTGRVEASRHRAIAPVSGPVNAARPHSGQLDVVDATPPIGIRADKAPPNPNARRHPASPIPQANPIPPPQANPIPIASTPPPVPASAVAPTASPPTPAPSPPAPAPSRRAVTKDSDAPQVARPRNDSAPIRAASAPELAEDGTPDRPRARSISGEIRVPVRRAASIKPPMPEPLADADEEDSGPVILMEANDPDEDPTGPRKLPPRRKQKPNPPELAERGGEIDAASKPIRAIDVEEPRIIIQDEPPVEADVSGELKEVTAHREVAAAPSTTIEVSDDTSVGVIIHEHLAPESEPVLLERKRPSEPPTTRQASEDSDVVELQARKKPKTPSRPDKRTQVGIGALPAMTRSHRDTDASGVPAIVDDGPTEATLDDPTRVDARAVPPSPDDITDETLAAPPAPNRPASNVDTVPSGPMSARITTPRPIRAPSVERAGTSDEEDGPLTSVMSAVELDEAIPERDSDVLPAHLAANATERNRRIDYDPVDDGWGPPGTTIPPPLLGAMPGSDDPDEEDAESGRIPVSNLDAQPLILTPPTPPLDGGKSLVRELEEATSRSIELIRSLEHAQSRDDVVALLIAHLADSHSRSGFFSIKGGELGVFAMHPKPDVIPVTTLRLERPSTLQDVVGTRLPYRGPMHDDDSRNFLAAILGTCPPEILLVPVAIRERVVGVLYGDHRLRHTFDDQVALAARAAGMALERILKTKQR